MQKLDQMLFVLTLVAITFWAGLVHFELVKVPLMIKFWCDAIINLELLGLVLGLVSLLPWRQQRQQKRHHRQARLWPFER
tara:strand:+ start:577 stop:816 length:240 start_codon:yes stop_codon:yes gene_type:complete